MTFAQNRVIKFPFVTRLNGTVNINIEEIPITVGLQRFNLIDDAQRCELELSNSSQELTYG